jgi:hypothetical protein
MIARNRVPLGILVPLSKIDVHLPVTFDEPDIKLIEQYRKIDRLKKILQCLRPHFNDNLSSSNFQSKPLPQNFVL